MTYAMAMAFTLSVGLFVCGFGVATEFYRWRIRYFRRRITELEARLAFGGNDPRVKDLFDRRKPGATGAPWTRRRWN